MDGMQLPAAAALTARYGAGVEPKIGPWNDTMALLLSHRSVRGYRPDALPAGTLESLIAAAQSAATSSNLQTWSVVAVNDPEKRKALAEIAGGQRHIEQCPIFLVFIADVSRNERLGQQEGVSLAGMPFLETFLVAAIDAGVHSIGKKILEEAGEVWLAAEHENDEALAEEISQLIYHLQVLMLARGLKPTDIYKFL